MNGGGESGALHQRIYSDLEAKILSGEWPPGHRIPFELDLTAQYGCSRMTVNKALGRLADSGLIERRRKAGSFVRRPGSEAAVLDIHDIRTEVEALNLAYRFAVLRRRKRVAEPADLARIASKAGAPLLELRVLHHAGDEPFCMEDRLIDLDTVPAAADETFEALAPGPWLVARVPWSEAEHTIGACAASADMARTLLLDRGEACLVIHRRTWQSGAPVTHVRLVYPADRHKLVARFTPSQSGA